MKILVVGSGGREHALCWAISGSPMAEAIYCAPGNAGIAEIAQLVPIPVDNLDGLVDFCITSSIDFVIVGPELPLTLGLVDRLNAVGIKAFGPSAAAARLEGSKAFTKDLLQRYGIRTAAWQRFTDAESAKNYVREQSLPIVIKADGLAAGKGVTIAETLADADQAIDDALIHGQFGTAGAEIIIEEFLVGEEVSFFALSDGDHAIAFGSAQDHKRVGNGDTGPNTGGMGAYSPAPCLTDDLEDQVMEDIVVPTLLAMQEEDCPFRGVLFCGLMLVDGPEGKVPYVIEFNARFGDPECQVLMPRLRTDLLSVLLATADGTLDSLDVEWQDQSAICVVMAALGYPGNYHKLTEIQGLEEAGLIDQVMVFHAGTERDDMGRLLSNGGRVLGIMATAPLLRDAQKHAYQAIERIDWPNGFCRSDIGWRALTS